MDDETVENFWIRIRGQTDMGNIVMGVCYRQSDWDQHEEGPCLPPMELIWCFDCPVAIQARKVNSEMD